MSLDCGRKPEYPEETHADTGRTCKLHTERPWPGFKPRSFLLCSDSAIHYTVCNVYATVYVQQYLELYVGSMFCVTELLVMQSKCDKII
ncbi:hypothetical protein AAFF_G00235790 [Aldrovandia affinis]|uniref:Uncharacterized protein n=1 Tax=Aldrovandia affinis TaxID=143900 RepID=A0AAD7SV79_9TELE|nr:hypothetical protein AAFF_G00235790 [Aldrovandia affinis]